MPPFSYKILKPPTPSLVSSRAIPLSEEGRKRVNDHKGDRPQNLEPPQEDTNPNRLADRDIVLVVLVKERRKKGIFHQNRKKGTYLDVERRICTR